MSRRAGQLIRTEARQRETAKLIELYVEGGFSLREVDELTGVPYNTVRSRLKAAGVEIRPRGAFKGNNNRWGTPHEILVKTAFLYERMGYSANEIAEFTGSNSSTVRDRLLKHGVKLRDKGESMRIRFARRPMERDNTYLHQRPARPQLTDLQILALARATAHGKLIVTWQWCDEPNAFDKRTLDSLTRRGMLKRVDPVQRQDDGTWVVYGDTPHVHYVLAVP